MELRATLARLRKENGFSQAELAEELGVTRQAVSRWETGAAAPTTDNLICLSQLFGVTMDELVTGRSAPPDAGMEVPPFPDAESPESEPPPPAARDAPQTDNHRAPKMLIISICAVCFCCVILIWGECTDSMLTAKIFLFFVLVIIAVIWLARGIHIIFMHYKKG